MSAALPPLPEWFANCLPHFEGNEIKLPKQWLYWAASMHLQPEQKRGKWRGFSLKGRGRRWRVNMYGEFQMSKPEAKFDRWANSSQASCKLPKTHAEFKLAIALLGATSCPSGS